MSAKPSKLDPGIRSAWLACVAVIVTVFALACWTWGNWGDIRIDCGREMYVPDAILHGKVLYRDLWYPYGPLTPYLQAALFYLFGATLNVLYGLGLAITVSCAFLLLFLSRRCLHPLPSFLVVLCFLLQAFHGGLFNFILPYSYAATIGCLQSLLCAFFALRYLESGARSHLSMAGVAAGIALIAKIEFGTSCFLALLLVLALRSVLLRSWRPVPAELLYCTPGLLIGLGAYTWFAWRLSYRVLFEENLTLLPGSYFMRTYGARWLDLQGVRFDPRELMLTVLSAIGFVIFWFLAAVLLKQTLVSSSVMLLAIPPIGLLLRNNLADLLTQMLVFPRGMFWIGVIVVIGAVVTLLVRQRDADCAKRDKYLAIAVLGTFGLLAGSRVMTRVTSTGYATFYTPLLVIIFFVGLCFVIRRAARGSATVSYIALSLEGIALFFCLLPNSRLVSTPLKTARGTIYTSPDNARVFSQAIAFIQRSRSSGEKVLVAPEDNSLYFFAGVESPSRWYALTPGVLSPAQEKEYIAEVERARVEYILFSNRISPEYGDMYFGTDYDRQIGAWIRTNYKVIGELGHFERSLFSPPSFLIYKRQHT